MKWRHALPAVVALAVGSALSLTYAQSQPTQTFRTRTDVVVVDVAVRDGGKAVTGLTAADFILTDNGVRQRIESVEPTAVPIDVTLVVDLSGSPRSPDTAWVAPSKAAGDVLSELGSVARLLRPTDRIRLLSIDDDVRQLMPMQPASSSLSVAPIARDGRSALFDALATALLQPVEPARRHVVVARTKGLDTISSIDAMAVQAIAERSDALFHLVVMETALDYDAALKSFQCMYMGFCWPTRQFWIPFERRLVGPAPYHHLLLPGQAIASGATATGGALHQASGLTEPTLTGTFRKAFEDFRNSYLLRYTPEGVPQRGWHTIDVEVPRSKSLTVRARKGYLVEDAASPPPPPPTSSATPRTLAEMTRAYDRGAFQQVVDAVRQVKDPVALLRDFTDAGNPWPATPRREAAFALDLAEPALFSTRAETRRAGHDFLDRFSRLVRPPLEPDQFERYWYFSALTLLEGTMRPDVTSRYVERALRRFPDEPRFVLSRAIVTDQDWSSKGGDRFTVTGAADASDAERIGHAYGAAMAFPDTGVEARVRYGWFLHRTTRDQEALAVLTAAGASPIADRSLNYLRHLFLGHVRFSLGQPEEAIAAYRTALDVQPGAQSARVALMNALAIQGDRVPAEALAEQVQSTTDDAIDPWWMYRQGQYRLHRLAIARLREMSR